VLVKRIYFKVGSFPIGNPFDGFVVGKGASTFQGNPVPASTPYQVRK